MDIRRGSDPAKGSGKTHSSLQTGDFAIRLGGDKFLLAFQQLFKKEVCTLLDQTLNELEEESREFPCTMGLYFGITQIMANMELSAKKIIMYADDGIYLSKCRYRLEQSRKAFVSRLYHKSEEVCQFFYDRDLLLSALVQSNDDHIYVYNMKEDPFYSRYSRTMVEEFDLPSETVYGAVNVWGARTHKVDQEIFLEGNQEVADNRVDFHNVEYRVRNHGGEWMWFRYHGHAERDEDGQPILFAGIIINLGRKDKTDYLSDQFNRYELGDTLQIMVAKEEHFFMMIPDLGGFPNIDKLYNHRFGDEVLAGAAQIVQFVLPECARLYCNDGDGFIIPPGSYTNSNKVVGSYHRLQQELGCQRIPNGKKYHCTVSVGRACFPEDGDDMMLLTKDVGYALEASKRNGKNRLTFYEKKMSETELQELNVLEQLCYSM